MSDVDTPEAVALQVELAIDALYDHDVEGNLEMAGAALETARSLMDRSLIAIAASALILGEAGSARTDAARAHRAEVLDQIEHLDDAELAHRLEMFYYLGRAENYLEHYDQAIAHAERGLSVARATAEGRPVFPLMLLQGYPLEMQGRLAEAREICETAVEIARLSATPHFLFWALCELAWVRYYAGDLDGAVDAGEESVRISGHTSGGTMPSAGGGAGWTLAAAHLELGEVEKARQLMLEVGGEDMENWAPVERFINWEHVALAELALGNNQAAAIRRVAHGGALVLGGGFAGHHVARELQENGVTIVDPAPAWSGRRRNVDLVLGFAVAMDPERRVVCVEAESRRWPSPTLSSSLPLGDARLP